MAKLHVNTKPISISHLLFVIVIGLPLGGCVDLLSSQPTLTFTWFFMLGGFFAGAYLMNSIAHNRIIVIGGTFLLSIVVAAISFVVVGLTEENASTSRFFGALNFALKDENSLGGLGSVINFVFSIIIGSILAIVFSFFVGYFPRLPLNAFLASLIPLFLSFFFWELNSDGIKKLNCSLSFLIFGVFCSSALLSIGLVTSALFLPLALLIVSTGGLGYLSSRGPTAPALWIKINVYAASFILLFELLTLINRVTVTWDRVSASHFR